MRRENINALDRQYFKLDTRMFIGHFAIGFAAKKAAPKTSLGTLILSVQLLDLLWPILLILGLEHAHIQPGNTAFTPLDFYDYPISHSLLTVVAWGLLFGVVYYAIRRYTRGAWILAAGVLSHWILDFITHRPDLPLMPGPSAYVGLGLWNSIPATMIVEGLLFALGVFLYVRSTEANDRSGRIGFWALVGVLAFIWIGNAFGSAPPNEAALGWIGLATWLFVPWGYWIDRHRKPRTVS
jgi:hypothetical protein